MANFKREVNKNTQKQQQEKNNEQEFQLKEPEYIMHYLTGSNENNVLFSNRDSKKDD